MFDFTRIEDETGLTVVQSKTDKSHDIGDMIYRVWFDAWRGTVDSVSWASGMGQTEHYTYYPYSLPDGGLAGQFKSNSPQYRKE